MKRTFVCTLTAAVLLPLLFSCTGKKAAQDDKEITLVMAEVNPPNTVVGRMDAAFKEKVEELSGGKITIDLQCSGILGSEKQVLDLIKSPDGSIQLMRGPSNLTQLGKDSPAFKDKPMKSPIISIPFTFNDDEHFWKFAHSDIAQEILDEPYINGLGVKGLFYVEEGFRHLFATSLVQTVADMKGKKFRVSGDVLTALGEALGAEGVKVDFPDLYAALQTGKADVAENPLTNYLSNSFNEVAPYLVLDGHMLGAGQVMINAAAWDSLSAKQQEILMEAGRYAQDYCKTILSEANAQAIAQVKASGGTVFEVTDKTPWQEACADMRRAAADAHPDLYQKILDLAK